MTPKEKAKELFDKMKGFRVKHTHSKKCALVALEEIIKEQHDNIAAWPPDAPHSITLMHNDRKDYWQKVKEEIQKL